MTEPVQKIYNSIQEALMDYARLGVDAARRPKPPTRAEIALNHFESFSATFEASGGDSDLIHDALVRLKQLEDSNG